MRLSELRRGVWSILAIDDGRADNVEVFLDECKRTKDVDALLALFEGIAAGEVDPRLLPDSKCHDVADKIWQFTQGKIRVLWFYDEGRLIITCLAFLKATKKTPNACRDRAQALRRQYFEQKKHGTVDL